VLISGNHQVFAKREPNGETIVGLFNTGGKSEEISVSSSTVGLAENKNGYSLHELWTGETTGETKKTGSTISAAVLWLGVVLYRVKEL
jgi:Alpha galactosidase C-terminal beta sandwich domain